MLCAWLHCRHGSADSRLAVESRHARERHLVRKTAAKIAAGSQRQSPLDGQSDEQIEAQALADLAQRSQRQRRNRPESDVPVNDEIVYATSTSFPEIPCPQALVELPQHCAVSLIACIDIL